MAMLKVLKGGATKATYVLDKPSQIVGRDPNCDIQLKQTDVSRKHAEIITSNSGFQIVDHDSRNGTHVNLTQLTPHRYCRLRDGDIIRICDFDLLFSMDSTDFWSSTDSRFIVEATQATAEPLSDDSGALSSSSKGLASRVPLNAEAKLNALMRITRDLHGAITLDDLLEKLPGLILAVLPQAERATIILPEKEGGVPVPRSSKRRGDKSNDAGVISKSIVDRALQNGEAIVSADVIEDSSIDASESIESSGIKSLMCAPIVNTRDESIGAIQVDTQEQAYRFTLDDLDLLTTVAMQISLAIETARYQAQAVWNSVMRSQLMLAREIQASLLPRATPELNDYAFFHFYTAAHDVSGDCFDYVPITDDRIAVVVADVCGKAIPAALLMASFASEVRAQLRTGRDAAEAVKLVNAAICARDAGRFITMILLVIDPTKHEIEIVNAGHWPPVLRRCDRSTVELTSGQPYFPLGLFPDVQYQSIKTQLEPGETILAFSDGIIDAQNVTGKAYEYERLCQCFAKLDGSAIEMGRGLQRDVMQFSGDAQQIDDICFVCFSRNQ